MRTSLRSSAICLLFFQCQVLTACMLDSDCRSAEKCLKREKNGYGFCILNTKKTYKLQNKIEKSQVIEIEGKEKAINYFGDSVDNLRSISPNGKIGQKCHSTPDCDRDQECLIVGFEGRCVQFQ